MGSKAKRTNTRPIADKQSRAALWTIQLAVEAVADGVHQLKTLQHRLYRGHQAAVWTLQMARHHSLKSSDQKLVEEGIGDLSRRVAWPGAIRKRTRREHLERPLTDTESGMVRNLASSAARIAAGTLDINQQLDAWYGGLVLMAAATARAALAAVTVETHQRRAAKLMQRLDMLCRDERVVWAFTAGSKRSFAGQTLH